MRIHFYFMHANLPWMVAIDFTAKKKQWSVAANTVYHRAPFYHAVVTFVFVAVVFFSSIWSRNCSENYYAKWKKIVKFYFRIIDRNEEIFCGANKSQRAKRFLLLLLPPTFFLYFIALWTVRKHNNHTQKFRQQCKFVSVTAYGFNSKIKGMNLSRPKRKKSSHNWWIYELNSKINIWPQMKLKVTIAAYPSITIQ